MTTLNSKKRGRPLGSKNKKPAAKGAKRRADKFKRVWEGQRAADKIIELEKIRENLHRLIDNLEHQATQYQAVISYLENKLEQK